MMEEREERKAENKVDEGDRGYKEKGGFHIKLQCCQITPF